MLGFHVLLGRPTSSSYRRAFSSSSSSANIPSSSQSSLNKVSLDRLWRFGPPPLLPAKVLESAELTRSELCQLLQRRVNAHLSLPYLPASNPHIKEVMAIYRRSCDEMSALPPIQTVEHNSALLKALMTMVDHSSDVIGMFATGFKESKRYLSDEQISTFLNRAMQTRISIRLLAEQHLSLSQPHKPSSYNRIGIVDKQIKLKKSLESVLDFVAQLCEGTYGFSPEWQILGDTDLEICFVEMHLQYVLIEVLKNAFRATVEHHQELTKSTNPALPPIEITISAQRPPSITSNLLESTEEKIVPSVLYIRIRDRGGGIDPKNLSHVFSYAFSTVGSASTTMDHMSYHADLDPMVGGQDSLKCSLGRIAGLGFGLPMAKLYCRYFGGNLELVNMHGIGGGVDSYLTMTVGTLES